MPGTESAVRRLHLLAAAVALCILSAGGVRADEASSIDWKPQWRRPGAFSYALASTSIVGLVALEVLADTPPRRFRGELPLDSQVRDWLAADSTAGRNRAVEISDVGLYSALAYPILDVFVVAGLVHGNADTTWQLTVINAQTLGAAGLLGRLGQKLVGRERPYVQECEPSGDAYHKYCPPGRPNESFISGHTAISTAAAAVSCTTHLHVPLYGGGLPDQLACAGALGVALTTSSMRLVGDMHYASDILMGLGLGASAGFLLPYILHFQRHGDGGASTAWIPIAGGDRFGLRYLGRF